VNPGEGAAKNWQGRLFPGFFMGKSVLLQKSVWEKVQERQL